MLRLMVLCLAWAAPGLAAAIPDEPSPAQDPVELRGFIVCLDQAGRRHACSEGSHQFALEDAGAKLHRFLPDDPLAAIFEDPRVRERELVVRVRSRPDGAADLIKVYSVNHGKLHDLRYFCDLCNITAYVPGPCPCCRVEMELRETPVP